MKVVSLEVSIQTTKYIFLFHEQDTREVPELSISNEVLENVIEFKYLLTVSKF